MSARLTRRRPFAVTAGGGSAILLLAILLAGACAPSTADLTLGKASGTTILQLGFETSSDTDEAWPADLQWNSQSPTATARLDTSVHGGRFSLQLANATQGGAAVVQYLVPDSLWQGAAALELTGWLRTHDVAGGVAGIWMRVDGADRVAADSAPPSGRPQPLAFDNMLDRGPTGTTEWKQYEVKLPVPAGAARVVLGALVFGTGTAWADNLELTAIHTLPPPSPEALAYAFAALDTMQAHAYRSASVPWDSLRAALPAALNGARTPRDTHRALGVMVARVDRHSSFLSPELMAVLSDEAPDEGRLPSLLLPRHERLEGRFGYLTVPAYEGIAPERMTRYADALQNALADLDQAGVCGYVVDLRPNQGGNMFPMLAGLGSLLGETTLGAMVTAAGVEESSWRYAAGGVYATDATVDTLFASVTRPIRLSTEAPPVAVLIGSHTASSGEAVTVSFRGRAATRFFGEPTAGLTTGNAPFLLPDGAAINLTTSAYADRTGRVYDEPIIPDEVVAAGAESGALADEPAIRAAVAWLGAQAGCRAQ